jgi:hypothetical protein
MRVFATACPRENWVTSTPFSPWDAIGVDRLAQKKNWDMNCMKLVGGRTINSSLRANLVLLR